MPRLSALAPDLVVSPDGVWAAALAGTRIHLYDLESAAPHATRAAAEPTSVQTAEPLCEAERPDTAGRLVFVGPDRLLHLYLDPEVEGEQGAIMAELLSTPTLEPVGRGVRITGSQRILGVSPAGAVVAPLGPGADIILYRNGELVLQRTFTRSEVLSALPAPARRFLLEQRGGFEIWDPVQRRMLSRLVLNTRQLAVQLGYVWGGRMLWAITGSIPVHLEVFRASDGRKTLELDQPGRSLAGESAPGRLVIAVEERTGNAFLDIDLSSPAVRRLVPPAGGGRLSSYTVRPTLEAPEILALSEDSGLKLLRMSLTKLKPKGLAAGEEGAARPAAAPARPAAREAEEPTRGARPLRSEAKAPARRARPESAAAPIPLDEPPAERDPRFRPARSEAEPEAELEPYTEPESEGDGGLLPALALSLGGPTERAEPAAEPKQRLLTRAYDASQSPAAWQWELARWAQPLLLGKELTAGLPPDGGPLAALGSRLKLSPVAQRVVALLHAAQFVLGSEPRGLRPVEIAICLSGISEEPAVLAELLPSAVLRTQAIVRLGADGRIRLSRAIGDVLLGTPCPGLLPVTVASSNRELLGPGIHLVSLPCPRVPTLLSRHSLLRVDGLNEARLLPVLEKTLRRAWIYEAAVLLDGVAGLTYPTFNQDPGLSALRKLLQTPRVPVLLCALPEAVLALGLSSRVLTLPTGIIRQDGPAPLTPSAPLPLGTSFRAPILPVSSAQTDPAARHGRLEVASTGDRRAAIVVGPSASPEAYAAAAYLAARDGSVLHIDVELNAARVLVLQLVLRQIPVVVTATPPGGPSAPWPPALAPYAPQS